MTPPWLRTFGLFAALALAACARLNATNAGDGAAPDLPRSPDGAAPDDARDGRGHDYPSAEGTTVSDAPASDRAARLDGVTALDVQPEPDAGVLVPVTPPLGACINGWCWANPLPQGNDLLAVHWTGSALWAAGTRGTLLKRPPGVAWGVVASGTSAPITGLATDGSTLFSADPSGVRAFSGGSWATQTTGLARALWGTAGFGTPGRLWAVGAGSWLREGASWTALTVPDLTGAVLTAVHGSGAAVWAVGTGGRFRHYDGSGPWVVVPSATTNNLEGVCAQGAAAAAVGESGTFATASVAAPPLSAKISQANLHGLWCNGAERWAVGDGTILHYGATAGWTPEPSPTQVALRAITDASGLVAVGDGGTILRRTPNGIWKHDNPTQSESWLLDAWSARPDDIWFVGSGGQVLRWRGAQGWEQTRPAQPNAPTLYAVWGSSAADVWIAGGGGLLLHWNGAALQPVASGTAEDLYALWGSGGQHVVAVGRNTTLLHYDGATWQKETSSSSGVPFLHAVWGFGVSKVWAVGSSGRMLARASSGTWSEVPMPSLGETLRDIWGPTAADLWIVGDGGTVLRGDGAKWLAWTGVAGNLYSVRGNGSEIWVAGDGGLLYRYDIASAQLVAADSGTQQALRSVFWDGGAWWMVGQLGAILRR